MKRFLTRAYHGEDFDGPEFAYIELGDELLGRISSLRRDVKMLCEKYLGIYCIELFDYTPEFLNYLAVTWVELEDKAYEEEFVELTEALTIVDDVVVRKDCVTLHILDDGVYWSGTVKHTDVHIETPRLPYKLLFGE